MANLLYLIMMLAAGAIAIWLTRLSVAGFRKRWARWLAAPPLFVVFWFVGMAVYSPIHELLLQAEETATVDRWSEYVASNDLFLAVSEVEPQVFKRFEAKMFEIARTTNRDVMYQQAAEMGLRFFDPLVQKYLRFADDGALVRHIKNSAALSRFMLAADPDYCSAMLRPDEITSAFTSRIIELRSELEPVHTPWRSSAASVIRSGAGLPDREVASAQILDEFMETLRLQDPGLVDALDLYDAHVRRGYLLSRHDEARICEALVDLQERIVQQPEQVAASILRAD